MLCSALYTTSLQGSLRLAEARYAAESRYAAVSLRCCIATLRYAKSRCARLDPTRLNTKQNNVQGKATPWLHAMRFCSLRFFASTLARS